MTSADLVLMLLTTFAAGLMAYGLWLGRQYDVLDRRIRAREERALQASEVRASGAPPHPAE